MDIGRMLLPAVALAFGIAASLHFFMLWRRHRGETYGRSLLLWGMGLFLMYWFQIPAILAGAGRVITVTDFNFFFALTLPITFLALVLIYAGVVRIAEFSVGRGRTLILLAWVILAIVFFVYQFISRKGVVDTHALPLVGNIALYLPLRTMILLAMLRLWGRPEFGTRPGLFGILALTTESVLGLARNFFVIKSVLAYPPQFWYFVMTNSRFFLVTQALSVILFAVGLCALHNAYHRSRLEARADGRTLP